MKTVGDVGSLVVGHRDSVKVEKKHALVFALSSMTFSGKITVGKYYTLDKVTLRTPVSVKRFCVVGWLANSLQLLAKPHLRWSRLP